MNNNNNKTTTLNNFEIKEVISPRDSRVYFVIVNKNNTDEAYFCFEKTVKEG